MQENERASAGVLSVSNIDVHDSNSSMSQLLSYTSRKSTWYVGIYNYFVTWYNVLFYKTY